MMRRLSADPHLIRIGNCSGFYGDRFSAVREMLEDGELDVLTGDYLAELTMLILARDKMKDPTTGYAKTFVRQMEDNLGLALDKGVQIIVNAGGVNPVGLAERLREVAGNLGLPARIAHVEGDDITDRAGELGLGSPLAANAYLGAWGIVECLNAGADVVVTGRVTDASIIVGPAAAHFGWERTDYDQIAGAMIAGHIIECSTQATGGNYSLFAEIDVSRPGFPIAEIRRDGSSVITKHPGTGGAVTLDTVASQLMYEIQGARYAGPDATARIDSIALSSDGDNRVLVNPVRGEAPPPQLKVSLNTLGGFRNEMEFVLTGLNIEAKAALVRRQLESWLTVHPAQMDWTLVRLDRENARTQEQASALLRCVVRDADPNKVGRTFTAPAIELALASYPGFHVTSPPANGSPYGVFTAGYIDAELVPHVAVLPDGSRIDIKPACDTLALESVPEPALPEPLPTSTFHEIPLGTLALARSGDKGGNANIGVWVRSDDAWRWLVHALTVEELRRLLPEAATMPITRTVLPHLRAVNFVIEGLLGEGVAYNARFDPQAKGLAEWLRSRHVEIPARLVDTGSNTK